MSAIESRVITLATGPGISLPGGPNCRAVFDDEGDADE
jgi:hypothetical protein